MTTESDFISCFSDGSEVKRIISSNGVQGQQYEEPEERDVSLVWRHREQILEFAIFIDVVDWPVGVLSTSVELQEGFLMQ